MNFMLPRTPAGSIQRSKDIGRVVHALEGLEEGKAWRVRVEEFKAERSDRQNAYYFGVVLPAISERWGVETHEAHEWFCGQRWGWKDRKVPRTPRNRDGLESVPRRTTTTDFDGRRSVLNKVQFEEFVEAVRRFAAEKLHLVIPDPDPALRRT